MAKEKTNLNKKKIRKMNLENEKRQTIILLSLLVLVLFLNSTGLSSYSVGVMFGEFLSFLFLGIILSYIYFKFSRREVNEWQRWRVIAMIALLGSLIVNLPSMISAFLSGFFSGGIPWEEGYQRQILK